MAPPSVAPCACSPVIASRECSSDYVQVPLSAESCVTLDAGICSAKECPEGIDLGSFARYAGDVDDIVEDIIVENREMLSELARR